MLRSKHTNIFTGGIQHNLVLNIHKQIIEYDKYKYLGMKIRVTGTLDQGIRVENTPVSHEEQKYCRVSSICIIKKQLHINRDSRMLCF